MGDVPSGPRITGFFEVRECIGDTEPCGLKFVARAPRSERCPDCAQKREARLKRIRSREHYEKVYKSQRQLNLERAKKALRVSFTNDPQMWKCIYE